jgi:hypothetical protein
MALLLALMSLSGAFIDVVIDAMMVIQAKKYPETGSQDLLAFSWMVGGIAAMIGGVSAAFVLQWGTPYICLQIYGLVGFVFSGLSLLIPKYIEEDQQLRSEGLAERSFCAELSHNYHIVKDCL